MAEQNNRFLVPPWVVVWTAAGVLALFIYLVRSVLPPFLIGAAGAYIASPVVANLQERRRLPRAAAIALVYLAVLVPIALLAIFFGPRFFEETRQLVLRTDRIPGQNLDMFFGPGP